MKRSQKTITVSYDNLIEFLKKSQSFFPHHAWLLKKGEYFSDDKIAKHKYKKGKKKACYHNSQMLAFGDDKKIKYYEGYSMGTAPMTSAMEHAFNVRNGKVIDTTLSDEREYFGVHIPTRFLLSEKYQKLMGGAYLPKFYFEKKKRGAK